MNAEIMFRATLRRIASMECSGGSHCSDMYGATYATKRRGGECAHALARTAIRVEQEQIEDSHEHDYSDGDVCSGCDMLRPMEVQP